MRSACCHTRSSRSASISSAGNVSSGRPSTYSTASAIEPSSSAQSDRSAGQRHVGPLRHEQEQRFVLDVLLERHRRPVVVRTPEERGAVAAVEEVGVAAVARVDLDEGAVAAVERRGVELGAPTVGPLERELVDRAVRRRAARRTTVLGVGRRFGAPSPTRTAAPAVTPAATATISSGTPAVPATANTTARTSRLRSAHRRHDRRQPRLPRGDDRAGAGDVDQRREVGRRHPGAVGDRAAHRTTDVEEGVEQREQRGAGAGGEHDDAEPAPALPGDDRDDHQDRERDGHDLGDGEQELPRRVRAPRWPRGPDPRSRPDWSRSPARRTAPGAAGPPPTRTRRTTSPGWRK